MYSQKVIDREVERLEARFGPLKRYSPAECDEFENYLFKHKIEWPDGDKTQVIASLPQAIQEYIFSSTLLSKVDFRYWCERYCRIRDDEGRLRPLRNFWPGQERLLALLASEEERLFAGEASEAKIRIIILKARQLGQTAIAQALEAHMVLLQPGTQGVVASDHPDNTLKLWQTLIRMYENLPGWIKPVKDSKTKATNLHFPLLDSDIVYGSGNQKTTLGQGMKVDAIHLTEVSTWIPECTIGVEGDLVPAFDSSHNHHSLFIMESTGEGARGNYYHDLWQASRLGKTEFKPLFLPWYMRPGWARSAEGIEFEQETKDMAARVQAESGTILSPEQLAWWQVTKIAKAEQGLLELFYQEHPSVIEEAFQTGYRAVVPIEVRTKMRNAVRVPKAVFTIDLITKRLRSVGAPINQRVSGEDLQSRASAWWRSEDADKWQNKLIVWEYARPGFIYTIGVDSSYGVEGGDAAAIEVLRVGNKWEPDEQVAEWWGENIGSIDLAIPCELIGNIYKDKSSGLPAKLAIEVQHGSPGQSTQIELMKRGYPHFYIWRRPLRRDGVYSKEVGWWTTPSTRPILTEKGVEMVNKGLIKINSPRLVDEFSTFVNIPTRMGKRHLEHAPGEHDDRIMSIFIALYVAHEYDTKNMADERRRAQEMRSQPPEEVKQFQEMGLSWEECMAKWEETLN